MSTPTFDTVNRQRVNINVAVDLDPVPGTFYDAEDHVRHIQRMLDDAYPHYHPVVTGPEAPTTDQTRVLATQALVVALDPESPAAEPSRNCSCIGFTQVANGRCTRCNLPVDFGYFGMTTVEPGDQIAYFGD